MRQRGRAAAILLPVILALAVAPAARAELLTYAFSGRVTAVENDLGFLSDAAVVGAPVSGSFTYTTVPNQGAFQLEPGFTTYVHQGQPPDTGLVLRVGDAEARSDPSDLNIMVVGDDNAGDANPPFTPLGDSFRYDDALDGDGTLFDPGHADQFHFSRGAIFLVDAGGAALSSQAPPAPLPLAALTDRYGRVYVSNDDDETLGTVGFRIDSIQQAPEPAAAALALPAGVYAMTRGRRRTTKEILLP